MFRDGVPLSNNEGVNWHSPQEEKASLAEEGLGLSFEDKVESLRKGAEKLVEKNEVLVNEVRRLLSKHKFAYAIPFGVCEELEQRYKYEPEMYFAIARVLEERHDKIH